MNFDESYALLDEEMRKLANKDGDVYLPNPKPKGKVDYIFICMEPSLGGWASDSEEANCKVKSGFRNFLLGIEPMLLHYCIREYLCSIDQTYFITDFSKGAMRLKKANENRLGRYHNWYQLLQEELNILSKPTTIYIAVGRDVEKYLEKFGFDSKVYPLIHYSPLAAGARSKIADQYPGEFSLFRRSVSPSRLNAMARNVLLESGIPREFQEEGMEIFNKLNLDKSDRDTYRKLLFVYKRSFEDITTQTKRRDPPN